MLRDFGCSNRPSNRGLAGLLLVAALGCSPATVVSQRDVADANDTGRTLPAEDDADRALLRELTHLPSGSPRRFGSKSVVAEAPYTAASGRSCRTLHFTTTTRAPVSRLACNDGKNWFFVPDVFGASHVPEH